MNLFTSTTSSSSSKSNFNLFTSSQNINKNISKGPFIIPCKTTHLALPPCSSQQESSHNTKTEAAKNADVGIEEKEDSFNKVRLVVRRPVKELSDEEVGDVAGGGGGGGVDDGVNSSGIIDATLSEFAKKMPMFEPERMESSSGEKPLTVNLDLALYKAKILTKNFRYQEAEEILEKVLFLYIATLLSSLCTVSTLFTVIPLVQLLAKQ